MLWGLPNVRVKKRLSDHDCPLVMPKVSQFSVSWICKEMCRDTCSRKIFQEQHVPARALLRVMLRIVLKTLSCHHKDVSSSNFWLYNVNGKVPLCPLLVSWQEHFCSQGWETKRKRRNSEESEDVNSFIEFGKMLSLYGQFVCFPWGKVGQCLIYCHG